jgi:hypothetical protein
MHRDTKMKITRKIPKYLLSCARGQGWRCCRGRVKPTANEDVNLRLNAVSLNIINHRERTSRCI